MKMLIIFYVVLAVIWSATSYKEPKEDAPAKASRRALPREKPYDFPSAYSGTHKKLEGLFANSTEMFNGGNVPVLALPPFTMTAEGKSPELLNLLTESAFFYLCKDKNVRIVRRDYASGGNSRIKPRHILIGRVGEIGNELRITVRIQDVNSGEILDAFDEYVRKTDVARFL